ncbi:hypothetical protein KCTC52924_02433 [Arenibacter antarcticus]|uniref:DUF1573 domain-containing protein n=1 Tax=Arenibacter antarcticus TaxID=2040469 RepID=A0ABW5VNA8_9FLAO|nr:DUF1573 domain-containing protein [Arenibacter sp. H213]MCM4168741.1 hypothetical protein [Arenibacter sp. H213]
MKRLFFTLSFASVLVFTSCKENASSKINVANVEVAAERDAAAKKVPVMEFDKVEHDFGTIEQNAPQETIFTFKNTGDGPLIITDAKSSCGCTIPEYPQNTPIAPGETGEMLVKFNGAGQNQITKTITVSTNTGTGVETLRIKAFITPKGAGPVGPVK